MALAYRMHSWPVSASTPAMVRRLLQSLRELREFHPEVLFSDELFLLSLVLPTEKWPSELI